MAGFIQSLQSICLSRRGEVISNVSSQLIECAPSVPLVLMRRLFTLFYRFGIDVWHYTSNGLVHTYEVELWKLLAISGLVVLNSPQSHGALEPFDNSPKSCPVAVSVKIRGGDHRSCVQYHSRSLLVLSVHCLLNAAIATAVQNGWWNCCEETEDLPSFDRNS